MKPQVATGEEDLANKLEMWEEEMREWRNLGQEEITPAEKMEAILKTPPAKMSEAIKRKRADGGNYEKATVQRAEKQAGNGGRSCN